MTEKEIADKLEELAKGIRDGKVLQENYNGGWQDVAYPRWELLVRGLRVKSEPKYIPFTADDWRKFNETIIEGEKQGEMHTVRWWCKNGCMLSTADIPPRSQFVTYQYLCDKYVFNATSKPVGKEVKE
jgi:hypothetical protein